MKTVLALILLFSAAIAHAARENGGRGGRNLVVRVQFNEYGQGLAKTAVDQIMKSIGNEVIELRATQYIMRVWGTRGEFTVCVDFNTNEQAQAVLNKFVELAQSVNRGSTLPLVDVSPQPLCEEHTLNPVQYRGSSVEELILGEWNFSHESDGSNAQILRYETYHLAPSRGWSRLSFKKDGTFTQSRPGVNDLPVTSHGIWRLVGSQTLEVIIEGNIQVFDIVSIGDTMLRLRERNL